MLELITYEECDENCTLLKEPDVLHQPLPCELKASPISKTTMIESTTIVDLTTIFELLKNHNLHVNPELPST